MAVKLRVVVPPMDFKLFALAACALTATGCSSASGGTQAAARSALPSLVQPGGSPSQYLSHVIVIIQENRSFENFFAGYPGANAPMAGCAIPVGSGTPRRRVLRGVHRAYGITCPSSDVIVPLQKVTFHAPDLQHNWRMATESYDGGKMDGFSENGQRGKYSAYAYVDPELIRPYWTMAQQYVLADAMFPTEFGGSFTAHLTLIAGTDDIRQRPRRAEVDYPDGVWDDCDSPPGAKSSYLSTDQRVHIYQGPFPCFGQFNTIAEVLDRAAISWKMYATKVLHAGMWEPFEAIRYTRYGPDWSTNVIAPQTTILTDPGDGQLADVSWVTPSREDSDHPSDGNRGPSWVASVVNAIGESPYWSTSAIIILWDDWGGWYDNAAPPQLDYRGLGERVPCLIVSPYARQGYVSHTPYEYGSILRFIEEVFNLGVGAIGPASKGYTDARANSLDDAFDFTQEPRAFTPIVSSYPPPDFLHEPPSSEPVDTQ